MATKGRLTEALIDRRLSEAGIVLAAAQATRPNRIGGPPPAPP